MAAKHGQSIKRQRYNWEEPSLSEAPLEAALSTPSCHPPGRCHAQQPNESKRARLQRYQEEEAERPVEAVAGAGTGRLVVESSSPCLRKGLSSLLAGKSSPLPRLDDTRAILPHDSDPMWDCHRQKPGRYSCSYCGRLCAKPSVLQKHVRSHTGERPYPCVLCGFSFKTKSNLYKHCKSRAHREKEGWRQTGLEGGQVRGNQEEPTKRRVVDPEDENCLGVVSSPILKEDHQVREVQESGKEGEPSTGEPRSMEDPYADGPELGSSSPGERRTLLGLSEETPPSLEPWTKGSTESGYFSRSESDDKSQVSPLPPAHPEVKTYAEIVLGKFGRLSQRLRNPHRGNPSRLSGQEEQRTSIPLNTPNIKIIEHITKLIATNEAALDSSEIDSVKPRRFSLTRRSSGESLQVSDPRAARLIVSKREVPSVSTDSRTPAAPFLRSHSLPSSGGAREPSSGRFRLSHSFDEWPTTVEEMGAKRLHSVPGCRLIADMLAGPKSGFEEDASDSSTPNTTVPESTACRERQPQTGYHKLHKRRKEENQEHEEGLSGRGSTFPPFLSVGISSPGPGEHDAEGSVRRCGGKGISVIQHTSSFDKILNALKDPQLSQQLLPKKHCLSRLVRQPKIQEPEILDKEQPDAPSAMSCKDAVEFRWPQRSPMLAQLPAEKLPPKKKRFCLAGEIPPCGEYSLERNTPQPHCSSWDSRASHTSSYPVSFEGKPDVDVLRDSQASCLVSGPSGCQRGHATWGIQSEAVRSIAPQQPLSQECSSAWKERRSRLLVKQVAVREPNQEKSTGQAAKEVSLIEPTSATPVCELIPSGLPVKESRTTPGHLSCHSVEFGASIHQQQKPVEEKEKEKEMEKPWSHHGQHTTSPTSTRVCSNSGRSSQRDSPELQQVNISQVNAPQVNVLQGVCICVCSQSRPVCVRGLWDSL